jgi:uncharacterized LabA/DUF88 family protein
VSKNVAVFVDVANIFYAAKAAGVDIDYVTLLKASSAGRDLVRAYAYTGLDPDNDNQRNFHEFLRRHGYKVVSKDIRKYGDGKVKANLDIELVVDMMKTARNLDIAIVVSGDGDFAPAIRAVQEMGVRVEVVSFRGNTSSDLIEVADIFTDITQIAKVEKDSSRSGRRVATDDEDLSMTEVPDKMTEGTGDGRRGRGRGRSRTGEPTPVAASRTRASRAATAPAGEVPLVVLPGEKLSKVAAAAPAAAPGDDEAEGVATEDEVVAVGEGGQPLDMSEEGQRRRRRRRGGRGRGRGRREEGVLEGAPEREPDRGAPAPEDEDEDAQPIAPPARRPAASAFGSVWDSQIGIPTASSTTSRAPIRDEDEDLDEPPIPEYLIAERRQRDAGRGRGRGGAYAAAMDRERFGGGRGSTISRFAEPAPRRDAGPNRVDRPVRGDRPPFRAASRPAPRPTSGEEPWSEVPPEIEAMLRAQIGAQATRPAPRRDDRPSRGPATEAAAGEVPTGAPAPSEDPTTAAVEPVAPKRTTTRRAVAASAGDSAPAAAGVDSLPAAAAAEAVDVAARRPAGRSTRAMRTSSPPAEAAASPIGADAGSPAESLPATAATGKRASRPAAAKAGSRTRASASANAADAAPATAEEAAAPASRKPRATRKKADAPA